MNNKFFDIRALFFIVIVVLVFYSRLFWPSQHIIITPDFGLSDSWHESQSLKYILWQNLQANTIPLWHAKLGSGYPIIGEGQTGIFFLPNLLLYKSFSFVTAYNLSIVLSIIFIGWGTFIWLRLLNLSTLAALFGALTLSFSGIVVTQIPHIMILQGLSLMPVIFATTYYMARKKSLLSLLLLSLLCSQQIFAGAPQVSFITLFFSSLYFAWLIYRKSFLRNIFRFLFMIIFTIALSAIQLLPSYEFQKNTNVSDGYKPEEATYFSYPAKHIQTLLDPFKLGNPRLGTYPSFNKFDGSIFWENTGYIGVIPLLFLFGLINKRRKIQWSSQVVISVILLGLSFLMMTGKHSPLYFIHSIWPFNIFRVPSRFLWTFIVFLVVLCSLGYQSMYIRIKNKLFLQFFLILLFIVHCVQLGMTWNNYHAYVLANDWLAEPQILSFIKANARIYTIGAEKTHNDYFLTKGWQDTNPYFFLRNTLQANSNVFWNIDQQGVYSGRQLKRSLILRSLLNSGITFTESEATISAATTKLFNILSVGSVISTLPIHQSNFTESGKVTDGKLNVFISRTSTQLPPAYLSTDIKIATTAESATRILLENNFIPGKSVLLETPQSITLEKDLKGETYITRHNDTHVSTYIRGLSSPAVLVFSDLFYPGWEATIDDTPRVILPANISQRAVVVPEGDHVVDFRYKPKSVAIGFWVSGISYLISVFIMALLLLAAGLRTRQKALLPFYRHPRNHDT